MEGRGLVGHAQCGIRLPSHITPPIGEMDQDSPNWQHCLDCVAISDIGLRRANNQDAKAVVMASSQEGFQQRGHLFLVADGMGAHAAGELASKLAADLVPLTYQKLVDRSPPEALREAIQDANRQIHSRGQASRIFGGWAPRSVRWPSCPRAPCWPTWATAAPTASAATGWSS